MTINHSGNAARPTFTPRAGSRIRPAERRDPSSVLSETPPPASTGEDGKRSGPNRRADGSFIVGKGATPVHTRWQKGQSGNPRGKKKGTPNTDTILMELMDTAITVKTATGDKKMSRKAALLQRMWELAAKGDLRAAKFLFDRYAEAQSRRATKDVEHAELSKEEAGMLDSFMAAIRLGATDAASMEAES